MKQQTEDSDKVLSFKQWCELIGVSEATGRRILNTDEGPVVRWLSKNRIGIKLADHRKWLASRPVRQAG
jgi:predicted DNA-binding transcriptional regulator AlpA